MRATLKVLLTPLLILGGVGVLSVTAWLGWHLLVLIWIAFAEIPFRFIHTQLYLRVNDYHPPQSSITNRDAVAFSLLAAFWIAVGIFACPSWRKASKLADAAADAIGEWRERRSGDEVSPADE